MEQDHHKVMLYTSQHQLILSSRSPALHLTQIFYLPLFVFIFCIYVIITFLFFGCISSLYIYLMNTWIFLSVSASTRFKICTVRQLTHRPDDVVIAKFYDVIEPDHLTYHCYAYAEYMHSKVYLACPMFLWGLVCEEGKYMNTGKCTARKCSSTLWELMYYIQFGIFSPQLLGCMA